MGRGRPGDHSPRLFSFQFFIPHPRTQPFVEEIQMLGLTPLSTFHTAISLIAVVALTRRLRA